MTDSDRPGAHGLPVTAVGVNSYLKSYLKSTYCFCAHMHEITKYFLCTENQEQCLNPSYPTPAGPVCMCTSTAVPRSRMREQYATGGSRPSLYVAHKADG